MATFEVGVTLPIIQWGAGRDTARWPEIRAIALRLEQAGADTLWIPDELLWLAENGPPRGAWATAELDPAAHRRQRPARPAAGSDAEHT